MDTVEPEEDDPPIRKGNRLTEREWSQICVAWESGGIRGGDLAKMYNITPESLSRGLKKRGAVYGKHAAAIAKQVAEAAQDDVSITIRRAKETREEHYKIARYLAKLSASKIQRAEKGEMTYARAEEELRPIMNAMKVNQLARAECWVLLGLDKDDALVSDDMPELMIREMTPDEVERGKLLQEIALREIGALEVAEEDRKDPDFTESV